jgi:hypothetical protein
LTLLVCPGDGIADLAQSFTDRSTRWSIQRSWQLAKP